MHCGSRARRAGGLREQQQVEQQQQRAVAPRRRHRAAAQAPAPAAQPAAAGRSTPPSVERSPASRPRVADQHRHDRHPSAGHGLHRRPEHDQRLLPVRQRQRWRQRPPAQAVRPARPDAARAGGSSRQEADPGRPRRRHQRRLRPAGVHDQPGLLEAAGHLRDGCRDRAGVLVDPEQRRGQHGSALQLRRRCRVRAHPAARQEDRVHAVQRAGNRLHRRRSHGASPRRRACRSRR